MYYYLILTLTEYKYFVSFDISFGQARSGRFDKLLPISEKLSAQSISSDAVQQFTFRIFQVWR